MDDENIKQQKALVIVDMQEAFFRSDGPLRQDYIRGSVKDNLISSINSHIDDNAQEYRLIVFVWADYVPNQPVKGLRTKFLLHANQEYPSDEQTEQETPWDKPGPRCVRYITKHYHSSFKCTLLDLLLRRNNVTHLTLAGVTANTCVTATASDARDHGYIVNVPSQLTAARNTEIHARAISDLSSQIVTRPPTRQLYVVNGSIPSWRCQLLMWEIGNLLNPSQQPPSSDPTTQLSSTDYNGRSGHDIDNINFQTIHLRIMNDKPETKTPEFLALNSRGQTPVFVSRTSNPPGIMAESRAICQYLTHQYLCSSAKDKRARVAQQLGWLTPLDLQRAYESDRIIPLIDDLEDAVFKGDTRIDIQQTRTRLLEEEMPIWEGYLKQMNSEVDSNNTSSYRYMGGSTSFTYADCFFYPILAFIIKRGFPISEGDAQYKWPYLRDYYQRCTDRLSCQRSMPVGWKFWKAGQSIF